MAVKKVLVTVDDSFVADKTAANVKRRITEVTNAVKNSQRDLAGLFIALCKRFTTTDSHTASNFENLINQLPPKTGKAVQYRLQEFSNNGFEFTTIENKTTIKTIKDGDNKFKADVFNKAVDEALKNLAASQVLSLPSNETEEEKKKKAREKAEKSIKNLASPKNWKENLEVYLKVSIENLKDSADISEDAFKLEVEKVLQSIIEGSKPVIDINPEPSLEVKPGTQANV
jgi:hypothetical protein